MGIPPDFELAKTAWNSSSRIWGTGTSFMDAGLDDEPTRRTSLGVTPEDTRSDAFAASPVRQTSSSGFGPARNTTNSVLSPVDIADENNIHPKMSWNSMSANVGFVSRPKGQPLSPTKYAQNQGLVSFRSSNGTFEPSSLFAGSAPDTEDAPNDSQQSYPRIHRTYNSPTHQIPPSTTRPANLEQHRPDYQINTNTSGKHIGNDPFGSGQRFENGLYHPSNTINMGNTAGMVSAAGNNFQLVRPGVPQHSSSGSNTYRDTPPLFPNSNDRVLPSQQIGPYSPSTQEIGEIPHPMLTVTFNQVQEHAGPGPNRRSSMYQSQYRNGNVLQIRNLGQPNAHSLASTQHIIQAMLI